MKSQVVVMAMLLVSIIFVGIVSGNNEISQVSWDNAAPANLGELVENLRISEQNEAIIAEKIKGYIKEPTDEVNFINGNIRQMVVNENGVTAEYFNLSAENQSVQDRGIKTYRFLSSDADTTITTEKLAIFVFYKEDEPVGFAWGCAKGFTTPTCISSVSSIVEQTVEAPVVPAGNTISEANWGNATAANLGELVENLRISEQNDIIVGAKIKGYLRIPTDGVYNFTHGNIQQLVINSNETVESYFNLSAENQILWDQNITVYRFLVNDADKTSITEKLVIFVFYKDCEPVGFAWGYMSDVKSTPTYIPSMNCIAGQILEAPTDSSGGGGSGPSSGPSGGGPSDGPSGPSGPSDPGPTG